MLIRLGGTFLLLSTLVIPASASDSKMLPACASTLSCEVDLDGRARCALAEFQSPRCSERLDATVITWEEVTATGDGELRREVIHRESRERLSLKSHSAAAAEAIAATPFELLMPSERDLEVNVTLFDPAGNLLWSSRLYLLKEEDGFRTSLNHPAAEQAGTTHHVAFEKSEP